jgi:hypothetical protein
MGNVRGKNYTAPSLKRSEMDNISVQPKTFKVQSWEAERYFSSHPKAGPSDLTSGIRIYTKLQKGKNKTNKIKAAVKQTGCLTHKLSKPVIRVKSCAKSVLLIFSHPHILSSRDVT